MNKPPEVLTLYGIRNCDTMKKAFRWLGDAGVSYRFHDFRVEGLRRDVLSEWCRKIGWSRILNTASATFRSLPESAKTALDERRAIDLMLAEPTMIKRPVMTFGGSIEVGFKPERYALIFADRERKG